MYTADTGTKDIREVGAQFLLSRGLEEEALTVEVRASQEP